MKTSIVISGQVSGNHTLRNAIVSDNSEEKKTMFYGYELVFPTKKAAKKALWKAYRYLCANEPEMRGSMAGIRYSKSGALYYDASQAELQ